MPRPTNDKKTRACLVCEGETSVAHLGLDVCRACAVFYRRSRHRKFACRSNSDSCRLAEGVNCRKCRLREMERMLAEAPAQRNKPRPRQEASGVDSNGAPSTIETTAPGSPESGPSCASALPGPSNEFPMEDRSYPTAPARIWLKNLSASYRVMCDARLTGELAGRRRPPHPLAAVHGKYKIEPATYAGLDLANQIHLTALLQFGINTFPEFASLPAEQQWVIVTKFFTRFRMFEAAYRSDRAYEDDFDKAFASFTSFFSVDALEHFFDDCPKEIEYREEAKRAMQRKFDEGLRGARLKMRDVALKHDEFLALFTIMFWNCEGPNVSETVTAAGRKYKEIVLKELHCFYRDELGLEEYATRLGELFMLMQVYEEDSVGVEQHFEELRLLDVFGDDNLVFRLS